MKSYKSSINRSVTIKRIIIIIAIPKEFFVRSLFEGVDSETVSEPAISDALNVLMLTQSFLVFKANP